MNTQNEAGAYTVHEDTPYILRRTATQNCGKGEHMKQKSYTIRAAQPEHSPDCVTVTRTGGVILTVKDCSRHNAKGTAGDTISRGTARHGGAGGYADTS